MTRFSKPSLGLSWTYFWHILLHYFYYHYWVVIGEFFSVIRSFIHSRLVSHLCLQTKNRSKDFMWALIFLSVNRFYSYSFLKVDRTLSSDFFFHS